MAEKSIKDMYEGTLQLLRLAELGQAVIEGHEKIKTNIPCKGVYASEQCKEKNTFTLGCSLVYFCRLQKKQSKEAAIHDK